MPGPKKPTDRMDAKWERLFTVLIGLWLMTGLARFGNPVVMDYLHPVVSNSKVVQLMNVGGESETNHVAYLAVLCVVGLSLFLGLKRIGPERFQIPPSAPRWLALLPLAWMGWQLLSHAQTRDQALSKAVTVHFLSCLAAFYIGLMVLGRLRRVTPVFWCMAAGLLVCLWVALVQHFGGLEKTLQMSLARIGEQDFSIENFQRTPAKAHEVLPPEVARKIEALQPELAEKLRQLPVEFVKKIYSERIFGTMFYPNALAGAVLLLLPIFMALILMVAGRVPLPARLTLVGAAGAPALACLFWSGSKSGWLIALGMVGVLFLQLPFSRRLKIPLTATVAALGLAGFFFKYSDYFQRGATSVGARLDYWSVAWQSAANEPILGSGPGTFQRVYKDLKRPGAESTRLVHNDYLQQATDSGWIGFILYTGFAGGVLVVTFRRQETEPLRIAARLSLLGWFAQGLVEFGLYIPALAWPSFLLQGWLLGEQPPNNVDKSYTED